MHGASSTDRRRGRADGRADGRTEGRTEDGSARFDWRIVLSTTPKSRRTGADGPGLSAAASSGSDGTSPRIDQAVSSLYPELRALAQSYLKSERADHTLQATALVNEAYLKLAGGVNVQWKDRTHFFAIAAEVIRHVLVDHARAARAIKRGGRASRFSLHEADQLLNIAERIDIIAVHEAIEHLRELSPRQARVVDLRFFGGLCIEETALVLNVSPRTVKDDWRFARAWLRRALRAESAD